MTFMRLPTIVVKYEVIDDMIDNQSFCIFQPLAVQKTSGLYLTSAAHDVREPARIDT